MKALQKIIMMAICFFMAIGNVEAKKMTTSSFVVNAKTGEILSKHNPSELRYPASLTKMMTLYITFSAIENGIVRWEDKLPVSRTAANRSPSKLGVKAGQKISVETAVKALIVKSANDCATVLAEALGHSEQNFAETMTMVAKELGMKNTTFKNASGLPNREQKTTAEDMAILSAAIYKHFPQYYDMFSLQSFEYDGVRFKTHNYVLKKFEGADGLKTGYTAAAGFNIATSAIRDGQRVIAVTMGHKSQQERDKKVVALMDDTLTTLTGILGVIDNNFDDTDEEDFEIIENINYMTWAVQLGSFSNYARARNFAKLLKEENEKKMADKKIEVEIEQVNSAIVYHSRIAGFSQEDADNLCNDLKKENKSCTVVESRQIQMAMYK